MIARSTSRSHVHPAVVLLGPFAPPVTGQTNMDGLLAQYLDRTSAAYVQLDTSHRGAAGAPRITARVRSMARALAGLTAATLRRGRTVIVFSYERRAAALVLPVAAALLVGRRTSKLVIWVHQSNVGGLPSRIALRLTTGALRGRLDIVGLCPAHIERIRRQVMPNARTGTTWISNRELLVSVLDDRSPTTTRCDSVERVGLLANLSEAKGLYRIINVARELADESDILFTVAGPASSDRDRAAIDEAAGTLSNFEYLGPVDSTERDRWLSSLSLFLYPTSYELETEPLVLLEAQRAGVPFVATAIACIPTIAGDADRLVDLDAVEDVEHWAAQVRQSLGEGLARKSMAPGSTDDSWSTLLGISGGT